MGEFTLITGRVVIILSTVTAIGFAVHGIAYLAARWAKGGGLYIWLVALAACWLRLKVFPRRKYNGNQVVRTLRKYADEVESEMEKGAG